MPRYVAEPKAETVKLRLNGEMRGHIEGMAKKKGVSMSEYIRELIQGDMIPKIPKNPKSQSVHTQK